MPSLPLDAFWLSVQVAAWTTLLLAPLGLLLGRWLAFSRWRGRPWLEAALLLPLVLPPTVIGYYLLLVLSPAAPFGGALAALVGQPLVFSFPGLVLASVVVNLPFAVQPVQQAYAALPSNVREAAIVSGLTPARTFLAVELPLTWTGLFGASALVFAHTLGEFGVVLMVGGNIEGVTRTLSIAIYDDVQAFDMRGAGLSSLALVLFSLLALAAVRLAAGRAEEPRAGLPR